MNTHSGQGGFMRLLADLGVLAFLIFGGTAATVWFLAQPGNDQKAVIEYATRLSTLLFALLLAQPGIFLTYKIATGGFPKMSMRRRVAWAVAAFAGLAMALPMAVGWHMQSFMGSNSSTSSPAVLTPAEVLSAIFSCKAEGGSPIPIHEQGAPTRVFRIDCRQRLL